MQKLVGIAIILVLASFTDCRAQRRADRTASGKAAYGVATVSGSGKIGKVKRARHKKSANAKSRRAKRTPGFRKKQIWAG
jgi:hypothetical protein